MPVDFGGTNGEKTRLTEVFGKLPIYVSVAILISQIALWYIIFFFGSVIYDSGILIVLDIFDKCLDGRKYILMAIYNVMFPVSCILLLFIVISLLISASIDYDYFIFSSVIFLIFGIPLFYLLFSENIFIPGQFLAAACSSGWFLPILLLQPIVYSICVYFIVGAAKLVVDKKRRT